MDPSLKLRARDDFGKARNRELVNKIFTVLMQADDELLPLHEVKSILKPRAEVYKGMKTVPIASIVGSEGRYRDFNRNFLPRHRHLRERWISIDVAHYQDKILPPIKLYELGGVYFVRDGNHRVSVARMQDREFIDAEVTALDADINLEQDATIQDIKRAIIDFERRRFLRKTRLDELRPGSGSGIGFTETGRFDDIMEHINVHKYYLNQHSTEEISFEEGMLSWYDNVYAPIARTIEEERILLWFPRRTQADLYVWIVRHWDELKKKYGEGFSIREAARDFRDTHGRRLPQLLWEIVKALGARITAPVRRLFGR